ncbi:MAG TPA: DUF3015 domain-containing protein [bacterium]
MKRILGILAVAVLFATPAFAANDGAGCGLGSQLFKGQSGLVPNVLAATTNGSLGNNTFGMTSGTSGCNADSVVKKEYEQQQFVAANLDSLSQEMAQGQGEHVTALAGLMGCAAVVQGNFAKLSQEKYSAIFTGADAQPLAVLASLKQEIRQEPALAASCSRIS